MEHLNMERMRRRWKKFLEKPRVLNPQPAAVTIVGFNVRNMNRRRSPNVKSKRGTLRINNNRGGRASPIPRKKNYSNMSKSEIQRLINSGANNRNELENIWVKKTAEQNSFNTIRKILNSGAITSRKHYTVLENAWLNKIIKYGTAHNLNQAMKSGSKYSNLISNTWSLRRIPTIKLISLVNRVPPTTQMGYNTAKALRNELERRRTK